MTTPLFDLSIPERYRAAAAAFTDRVQGTTDWDVPTPVKEWHARDIVGHLAWLPGMIGGGSSVSVASALKVAEQCPQRTCPSATRNSAGLTRKTVPHSLQVVNMFSQPHIPSAVPSRPVVLSAQAAPMV